MVGQDLKSQNRTTMYEYRLRGPTWPFFMIHDQSSYEVCETKEKLTQGAKNRYTE